MNKKLLSISDIKKELEATNKQNLDEILNLYRTDNRAGVKNLIKKYDNEKEKYNNELTRIEGMKIFEYKYKDCKYICGVDEAGRGPLAGPVVAGAVILPKDCDILYLNDSKQLSEKKREVLFDEIMDKAISVNIGIVESKVIDKINILQATYEAMREAVEGLEIKPDVLLNDAVIIPRLSIKQESIITGDAKSISIAAASIIAKVTRDRIMKQYDELYFGYNFAKHKGYGTKEHINAIQKLGASPIHRSTFIRNFI